jgi:hypothetical protein
MGWAWCGVQIVAFRPDIVITEKGVSGRTRAVMTRRESDRGPPEG